MDIQRLRYFVTAARLKSFSRAADALFITQQGISKAIASLENELQIQLFVRGKTISLTEAGKLILPEAEAILQHSEQITFKLQKLQAEGDVLRVAYADGILCNLRPDFFSHFLADHPEIDLSMINCDDYGSEQLLREQRADLAFCTVPYDEGSFEAIASMRLPILAVIGDRHPLAGRQEISLTDLAGERLISLSEETKHNSVFVRALAGFGLQPSIFIKPQEFQYQFDLCRSGRAIGFYSGKEEYVPEGIRLHPISDMPITSQYVILRSRDRETSVQMRLFADAVRREFDRTP